MLARTIHQPDSARVRNSRRGMGQGPIQVRHASRQRSTARVRQGNSGNRFGTLSFRVRDRLRMLGEFPDGRFVLITKLNNRQMTRMLQPPSDGRTLQGELKCSIRPSISIFTPSRGMGRMKRTPETKLRSSLNIGRRIFSEKTAHPGRQFHAGT
jgi:hypothetical protein